MIARAIWIPSLKEASLLVSTILTFVLAVIEQFIGESESAYSSVIKQPALPVFPDQNVRRWTVVLDSVTVNGKAVTSPKSSVKGAPSGKTIALLDTGASFALGPKAVIDAIYGAIPGSYYYAPDKVWVVPCTTPVDLAFVFG